MMKKLILGLVALMALTFVACEDNDDPTMMTVGFEDVTLDSTGYWNGADETGKIISDNLTLTNTFTDWGGGFTSWNGFSISNNSDITTAGYLNQYSCITGKGANNSAQFALFFPGWGIQDSIVFDSPVDLENLSVCNSTFAYLYMLNGDDANDKFGGSDGSIEDFLKLNIDAYNANNENLGSEEIYLADYRKNTAILLKEWTKVDLSTIKGVKYIKFSIESSDDMAPTYFCLDNISYYAAE